jgi:DNA-directed RNA polymerase subunit L
VARIVAVELDEQKLRIIAKEGFYEVVIEEEDDTIGNLLATYLEDMPEVQLSYYKRPHPLEEKIIVYVKLKDEKTDIKSVLEKAINKILEDIDDLRMRYKEALQKAGVHLEE